MINIEEFNKNVYNKLREIDPYHDGDRVNDTLEYALLFARLYKDIIRYCPEANAWYKYTGQKWEIDAQSVFVHSLLQDFIRLVLYYATFTDKTTNHTEESDKSLKAYMKMIKSFTSRGMREAMIKDAQSECPISINQFDSNPYLLNCRNVTFDLKTMTYHEHTPEDMITMVTNCDYPVKMTAKCPRWWKFLKEITMEDGEMEDYLQKALGYSISGLSGEECMFFAIGNTRNGKGTLLNTIEHLLGDYAQNIDATFVCKSKTPQDYSKPNPMLVALKAARFVTMSEPDDNARLNVAYIKTLTGNDTLTTRQLHGSAFSFIPHFKMWLSCNRLPDVDDRTIFTSDRAKVVEFKKHFTESERDPELKAKFSKADAQAVILSWLVEGYRRYQNEGLKNTEEINLAVAEYEKGNDKTGTFMEECCEITGNPEDKIEKAYLYTLYKNWCKSNGVLPKSAQKWRDDMDRYTSLTLVKIHGTQIYKGVKINAQKE